MNNTMKATEPPKIKTISIDFEFDREYVEKCNPIVTTYAIYVVQRLRAESLRRDGWSNVNCLFGFGTLRCGREIKIGQHGRAPTMMTIEMCRIMKKPNWCQDRVIRANKILRGCPDTLIQDFAIGTIKIIEAIKNDSLLKDAKFKTSFHIAYAGIQTAQSEAYSIVYDSTTGFIC